MERGELDKAEELFRQEEVLGTDDIDTLESTFGLSYVLRESESIADSETILRTLNEDSKRILGANHCVTNRYMKGLADVLNLQGRLREAPEYLEEAYKNHLKALGPDNPRTLKYAGQRLGLQWRILVQRTYDEQTLTDEPYDFENDVESENAEVDEPSDVDGDAQTKSPEPVDAFKLYFSEHDSHERLSSDTEQTIVSVFTAGGENRELIIKMKEEASDTSSQALGDEKQSSGKMNRYPWK